MQIWKCCFFFKFYEWLKDILEIWKFQIFFYFMSGSETFWNLVLRANRPIFLLISQNLWKLWEVFWKFLNKFLKKFVKIRNSDENVFPNFFKIFQFFYFMSDSEKFRKFGIFLYFLSDSEIFWKFRNVGYFFILWVIQKRANRPIFLSISQNLWTLWEFFWKFLRKFLGIYEKVSKIFDKYSHYGILPIITCIIDLKCQILRSEKSIRFCSTYL